MKKIYKTIEELTVINILSSISPNSYLYINDATMAALIPPIAIPPSPAKK